MKAKTHPMTCTKCDKELDTALCPTCRRQEYPPLVVEERKSPEKYFAARCRPLGLTAYGNTSEAAVTRLKQMFGVYIDAHTKGIGSQQGFGVYREIGQ